MPVLSHSYAHFQAPAGNAPAAPSAVTSITKDAGATISFLPGAQGDAPVSSWTVTPYVAGSAQSPQTVSAGSAVSLTGSDGNTYKQVPVTGLSNGTAYTFSVHGTSSVGAGAESSQSGANTPLSGLVFGDDFNGPAGGAIDPEWWVYQRCGYLAQNEVQYYLTDHCVLDGSGNLILVAEHTSYTGPKYASAGGGSVTQAWRSGACQSNAKTWVPATGNTMTFEAKFQVCPDAGGAMWPGLFWLCGQAYLDSWKTDPAQSGWNSTDQAEIDIAEWISGHTVHDYAINSYTGSSYQQSVNTALDFSASQHVFTCRWKPGASVTWLRDGAQTNTTTGGAVPASGCQMMLLLYLQIIAGSAASPQQCTIDYVRVFDQNLG